MVLWGSYFLKPISAYIESDKAGRWYRLEDGEQERDADAQPHVADLDLFDHQID